MTRALLLAVLCLLATASPASAFERDGLAIAEAYWGHHRCSGRVVVIYDSHLPADRDGEIRGAWFGTQWVWAPNCAIYVRPGLTPDRDCYVKVHEIGHIIYGGGHEGPMSETRLRPKACDPTRLEELEQSIRDDLPRPASWDVWCRRGRCVASTGWARVRRYGYHYRGSTGMDWWTR